MDIGLSDARQVACVAERATLFCRVLTGMAFTYCAMPAWLTAFSVVNIVQDVQRVIEAMPGNREGQSKPNQKGQPSRPPKVVADHTSLWKSSLIGTVTKERRRTNGDGGRSLMYKFATGCAKKACTENRPH
jgi:hypothetical protein